MYSLPAVSSASLLTDMHTQSTIHALLLFSCQQQFQGVDALAESPERRQELQNFGMVVAEVYRNVTVCTQVSVDCC